MSYKAVFSDLDGTLLSSKHDFSPFTKRVVQEIQARGIRFIIATGRHHLDVMDLLKHLGIKTTIITSNGARIHDKEGNVLVEENLDPKIAEHILKNFPYDKFPFIRTNVYAGDQWITNLELTDEWKAYHDQTSFKGIHGDLKNLKSYDNIIKIFFNIENNKERDYQESQKALKAIEKLLLDSYEESIVITAPLPYIMEVNSPKATKGQAVKHVLKNSKTPIDLKDVIAFGDGFNDFDMLSTVGKGCIMSNAHYTLKDALPNLEVIETNDADGVAKYLVLNLLLAEGSKK